jgi:hypothetical protein
MLLVVAQRLLFFCPLVLAGGLQLVGMCPEILLEILLEPSPHLSQDPEFPAPVLTGLPRDLTPIVIAIDGTDTLLNARHDRRAARRTRVWKPSGTVLDPLTASNQGSTTRGSGPPSRGDKREGEGFGDPPRFQLEKPWEITVGRARWLP